MNLDPCKECWHLKEAHSQHSDEYGMFTGVRCDAIIHVEITRPITLDGKPYHAKNKYTYPCRCRDFKA